MNNINYDEISDKIKKYFDDKYAPLKITNIEFQHSFDYIDNEIKKRTYKLHFYYDFKSEDGKQTLSLFDLPYNYSSTISFEHAFKKAKIVISAYVKTLKIDETT